ncbi:MAG: hypothetical protein ACD_62C00361G0003 [uncultured bacterium]|nr:MAG: hypothetical protein ACD_62C00361G0003 [uncultured bacterium]
MCDRCVDTNEPILAHFLVGFLKAFWCGHHALIDLATLPITRHIQRINFVFGKLEGLGHHHLENLFVVILEPVILSQITQMEVLKKVKMHISFIDFVCCHKISFLVYKNSLCGVA